MSQWTPEQMASNASRLAEQMRRAARTEVVVGLPGGEAASKIYGDGTAVLDVGMAHEYGEGTAPKRSFLEMPFEVKRDLLSRAVELSWGRVVKGQLDTDGALDIVGLTARNISVDAFSTNGYGQWKPLKADTIKRKGSSAPLIDTGTLRNSITWEVRDAT